MCCEKINGKKNSLEKIWKQSKNLDSLCPKAQLKWSKGFYSEKLQSGVFLPLGGFEHRREVLHY